MAKRKPKADAKKSDLAANGKRSAPSKPNRTTHRSSAGKKLYAVRDKQGRFKDIQTFERAHRQDIKRRSKSETASVATLDREAKALAIRQQWMRAMGIPEEEILAACNAGPFNLEDELAELEAVQQNRRLQLSNQELAELASKSRPPAGWLDDQ
jgi:hypothetical protein